MLLAKLSGPRCNHPDLVHLFVQDRTRISKFITHATIWVFRKFHHTLTFDVAYLRPRIKRFARAVGRQVGLMTDEELDAFIIWAFVDGNFRQCARSEEW